ncbi:MAG TPA: aromatic aminobenezylarsenical efflux permease ArsG family transporter [Synergistaceae bacterium]|nr:aromatic aminobenezylarsenical efflux permease ArsG family transporter [Synergistaceae bacterium]HPJ25266.1 aromatic aminobenezylarsenical efflux permease ArsG family transporter [Synergistaceae bacterium]HPQ38328.1 aromatic aminobenezylarsenical efflux permease ArsG family transporter [Synergistaceae bacterium]
MTTVFPLIGALWLGILASVSPCPLATNIAALSYLLQSGNTSRKIALSSLAYVLGRTFITVLLGIAVLLGLFAIPGLSGALQNYMNRFVGPLLILVSVFVLELLSFRFPWTGRIPLQRFGKGWGGAFLLGSLFGLALCPVSAALFFGALIPLAIEENSLVLFPLLFGIGTGLPVAGVAVFAGLGIDALSGMLLSVEALQRWIRIATGVILLAVGIYFTLTQTYLFF